LFDIKNYILQFFSSLADLSNKVFLNAKNPNNNNYWNDFNTGNPYYNGFISPILIYEKALLYAAEFAVEQCFSTF
jgi:hypothetical protein